VFETIAFWKEVSTLFVSAQPTNNRKSPCKWKQTCKRRHVIGFDSMAEEGKQTTNAAIHDYKVRQN